MKYSSSQIKRHKEYCITLGARRGARYKPMELVEDYKKPIKFAITKLTSTEIQDIFVIDPYSMIHSNFNYYSYKKTKKNLKYIRQYIEKTFAIKTEIIQRTMYGFTHNFIRINYKNKVYDYVYIDESYYDKESGEGRKNNKYPVLWRNTIHYKNIDGRYRNRYIECLIEDIKQKK